MDDLNVIESQKIDNCIVHICDNSFAKTISEEKQIFHFWMRNEKKWYLFNMEKTAA